MHLSANVRRAVAIGVIAGATSACSALPRSGPDGSAIESQAKTHLNNPATAAAVDYAIVGLSSRVLASLTDPGPGSLAGSFGPGARTASAPQVFIGIGDILQVSIFESTPGGLFLPNDPGSRAGNFVTLPQQIVDRSGSITVPYAGPVRAAGRSVASLQTEIETRLKQKAIEPQVVVAVVNQRATEAAVLGEVNTANKFPVNPAGDRITDLISRAGGIKNQGFESFVTLQRQGRSATVFFETLVRNPSENIYVAPGDTIYVSREQRSFTVFGASGENGRFPFLTEKVSLAESVGQAGGLLDNRAEPSQVYLYRLEDRRSLLAMGVDLSRFSPAVTKVPTIYQANFRDPSSFFAAQQFTLRDKDVLYVSNASSVELTKFLGVINAAFVPPATVIRLAK